MSRELAGIGFKAGIEAGVPADEAIMDPCGDCTGSTFVIFIDGTFPEDMLTDRCCFSTHCCSSASNCYFIASEHPGGLGVHRPAPHA